MIETKRGETLTQKAYTDLKAEILSCRLAPGQKVVISDLVATMDSNLAAVREALSRLTSEGLVASETNKGYRVAPITKEDLVDLTHARIMIESECLSDAIDHGDLVWESGIVASLFPLSRTPVADPDDPKKINEDWAAAHGVFHANLVAACQNRWLLKVRAMLYTQSERYRMISVPLDENRRDLAKEHKAIADAAIARDKGAAKEALRSHLEITTSILIDAALA